MRRILRRAAITLLVAALGFVLGFVPWWLAGRATRGRYVFPDRENAGVTPATFQLPFEDVSFRAADGVALSAWWVPAPGAQGTVVLVHGLNRSRIEMVRKVPFVHGQGWNALLLDLRHHGQSGGDVSSFGWLEQQDVRAAADYARTRGPGRVVLWGVSLGAASASLAAAGDPAVAGLVCDSSFRSLSDTLRHHVDMARGSRWWLRLVPGALFSRITEFWIEQRGGFDPAKVDVEEAIGHLDGRPALFVANSGDQRMPPEIAVALRKKAGPRAELLVVPGHSHGGAWREGTAAYEAAVADLLRAAAGREAVKETGHGG
jgi:pimeloyl-ACP methyl ester carboxylesterase